MFVSKLIMAAILVPLGVQAIAQSSDQYRPYNMGRCVGLMASGFDLSAEYAALDQRTAAPTTVPALARGQLARDAMEHYAAQCELMKSGQSYDSECPVGGTLIYDDYLQDAFEEFANLDAGTLRGLVLESVGKSGEARKLLRSSCAK